MKAVVNTAALVKLLKLAEKIVPKKSSMPILSHVLLETKETGLLLTATDLITTFQARLQGLVVEPGAVALDLQHLKAVAGFAGDELTLTPDAAVSAPAEGYPDMTPHVEAKVCGTIPAGILAEMLARTSFSMSDNDALPALCGLFLQADGDHLRVVSSDGHRLSEATHESKAVWNSVTMPATGVRFLSALLKNRQDELVIIKQDGRNHMMFWVRGQKCWMRPADGNFPDYRHVIPPSRLTTPTAGFNRQVAIKHLKGFKSLLATHAKMISDEVTRDKFWPIVALTVEEDGAVMEIEAVGVKVQMGCEVHGSFRAGLHVGYLLDALTHGLCGVEVVMEVTDPLAPIVFREEGYLTVVMPSRLPSRLEVTAPGG